jgi:hypothetical protein
VERNEIYSCDATPELNGDNEAYYVLYDGYKDIRFAERSRTCLSLPEALVLARETILTAILWKDTAISIKFYE